MTTIIDLADLAQTSAADFLLELKGRFGDKFPEIHSWTPETKVGDEMAEAIIDLLDLKEQQGKIKKVDNAAITKSDEAIRAAENRFVEVLKISQKQILDELRSQAKAIALSGGVNAGVEMIEAFMQGQERVTNAFLDEAWEAFDDQQAEIEQSAINLAKRAQDRLGNAVRNREKAKKRIEALNEQMNRLVS